RAARDPEKAEKPRRKEKDIENGTTPSETVTDTAVKLDEAPSELPPSAQGALQHKESEEKMNLESFLNYVAFNKKTQAPTPQVLDLSEASADRANAEAQMVLRGSMGFKRVDVAKDLFAQLDAASVDVSATTFTLMIEACVVARDLKSASDFLMKMEASGHSPNSELLDKVLDLYSNQKAQKEVSKADRVKEDPDAELDLEAIALTRQKLKSDAPIFVPSFGIPPPPPKPKPVEEDADE
ncbi:CWC27, partial [Symbiodinium natans]